MKRTNSPLHLSRSPLIYVVAQVNISAVVAIDRYVPEIQENLRKIGFPNFSNTQVPEIVFEAPGTGPTITSLPRYEFQDRDGRLGIVLTPKWIGLQTNRYSTFEEFHSTLKTALEIIQSAANIQLHQRIGLRYIDLVELEESEEIKDYLVPNLLGYDASLIQVTQSTFDFRFQGKTAYGQLVVRFNPPQVSSMFPPDLAGVTLNYGYRSAPSQGRASLLDFDHSSPIQDDFNIDGILEILEDLHDGLDIAFRGTVTKRALTKWGTNDATSSTS